MAKNTNPKRRERPLITTPATRAFFDSTVPSFTGITVRGFKSIRDEISIQLRPLTILSGANSSGKSSMLQPMLLLKQTVEAAYDPGALKLDGPNVKFTEIRQCLSASSKQTLSDTFSVGFSLSDGSGAVFQFEAGPDGSGEIRSVSYTHKDYERPILLRPRMTPNEIAQVYPPEEERGERATAGEWKLIRERFVLRVRKSDANSDVIAWLPGRASADLLTDTIHVPAFRGNRERAYPTTAAGPPFPGTFDNYVASVIHQWQEGGETTRLQQLRESLQLLELTRFIDTVKGGGQLEIRVGRSLAGQTHDDDLINIMDAGFGVSQALPVVVALIAAHKGSLVYIEEPEIHLHPRAQSKMAQLLARAAERGVIIVAETHSALLLQGIQTLVAQGSLPESHIKLHWFERDKAGFTNVRSGNVDRQGRFGKWPVDFYDVILDSEAAYLDAISAAKR